MTEKKKPAGEREEVPAGARDIFIANKQFPDAAAIFTAEPHRLEDALKTAIVVLDTNALLVPYGTGPETLAQIKKTYQRLVNDQRLVVPAQVAREFARNRSLKLVELHQNLTRQRDSLPGTGERYALLEQLDEYKRLKACEGPLAAAVKKYREALSGLVDCIRGWEWNDPVTLMYRELFTQSAVVEVAMPEEEIRKEHAKRFTHAIPPGYKDQGKDDEGIGDYLSWLTILQLGKERQRAVIFVSGDEKADWWHRSQKQPLYPRFELVDEFRRASGGQAFHIVKFSRLLELFGAEPGAVEEVRGEEKFARAEHLYPARAGAIGDDVVEAAVVRWLLNAGFEVEISYTLEGGRQVVAGRAGRLIVVDPKLVSTHGSIRGCLGGARKQACLCDRQNREYVRVLVCTDFDVASAIDAQLGVAPGGLAVAVGVLQADGSFVLVRDWVE